MTNFLKNKSKSPEKKIRSRSNMSNKLAKIPKVSRGPAHIDSITMRDPV